MTSAVSSAGRIVRGVETLLTPLDSLRVWCLRRLGRLARPLVRDRRLRVAVAGLSLMSFSFALVLVAPLWVLALGPVLLGVPHLAADWRYLVARPGLHRRPALWLFCGVPVAAAALGGGLLYGLLASLGALLVARASLWRRMLGALCLAPFLYWAWWEGPFANLAFAHLHNFIAVGLWLWWRPRGGRLYVWPLAFFLFAQVSLLLGAWDSTINFFGGLQTPRAGIDPGWMSAAYAPSASPEMAARLLLAFAFAQAVHYSVWLRLIPEYDRPQETPRSFRASFRALVADLGGPVLFAVVLVSLAIIAWGWIDLAQARDGYLSLALFHGHLELAVLALFWAEKGPRACGPA